MPPLESLTYHAPLIRSTKLPRYRLRSLAAKIQSFHHPQAESPPPPNPITVVCVPDTYGTQPILPPGDVLLHAGDLSVWGSFGEIQCQLDWMNDQPHGHKIVIAGNHDLLFDKGFQDKYPEKWHQAADASNVFRQSRRESSEENSSSQTINDLKWGNINYLENSSVEISTVTGRTIKVYGSPDTPCSGLSAFQYSLFDDVWSHRIPYGTDIILTHVPPRGHLDGVKKSSCQFLAREVARVAPTLVVYGHIHVGYGFEKRTWDVVGRADEAIAGHWAGWGALSMMALVTLWGRIMPRHLRNETRTTTYVNAAVVQGYDDHKVAKPALIVQI